MHGGHGDIWVFKRSPLGLRELVDSCRCLSSGMFEVLVCMRISLRLYSK